MNSLYREEDTELLTAGPFAVVQMDRFTIQDYAAKTGRPVEEVKEAFEKSYYVPVVDQDACAKCRKRGKICGFHALLYRTGEKEDRSEDRLIVREDACIGCGVCASNCPAVAIKLERVRNNEPAKSLQEGVLRMFSGRAKQL